MTSLAECITRSLHGHWYGYYGLAMCPAHENTRTPALSLSDGDEGRLLAYCHAGCSFRSIVCAMRKLGLLAKEDGNFPDRVFQRQHAATGKKNYLGKREAQANSCWDAALPITGSPAEHYLRSRGITCDLPPTLRFQPKCWHGPSAQRHPAMISMVEGGASAAVHRTFLRSDGRDKATLTPAKMMLGRTTGGAVHLTNAPGPLIVAEGIETALSLASGICLPLGSVWAALSTSGMAGLRLPERPNEIIIATDGDNAGRRAGNTLAERAHALGWRVSLLPAPDHLDWNDILLAQGTY